MRNISRKDFLKTLLCGTATVMGWEHFSRFASAAVDQPPEAIKAYTPPYLRLHRTGELKKRADKLWKSMRHCSLCPRVCGTDRLAGNEGFCHSSDRLELSSFHPHMGEEKALVGEQRGSGTIYFTNCNLQCVFCINYEANMQGKGSPASIRSLSDIMLYLQRKGCININLVTPSHYLPHILKAVDMAAGRGLRLPLVYNTSGWELTDVLRDLDGVIDVYLPDFKYWSPDMAAKYSNKASTYPELTRRALVEMNRQVGVANPNAAGIINRGLMIRHLIMPNNVGGTREVLQWISANLPKDTYVNLMSQYRPYYKASIFPDIARRITAEEYQQAVQWARESGLTNVKIQDYI